MGDDVKVSMDEADELKALKNHVDDATAMQASVTMDSFTDASFVRIVNDKEPSDATSRDQDCSGDFVCLKKDDLMKFATDPFWVRVRIVLLLLFGLTWISMLVAAIVIIIMAPKCPPQPDLDWWQKGVVYHIHPQSFMDANGDGFGDIEGIHGQIDYLADTLNLSSAVCIGPMYPTPNFNYGYNVGNFNRTCPHHYGNLSKLEKLRLALHKKGLKLLLDFIPNHTSRKHPWFGNSSQPDSTRHSFYKDFYIWHPGRVDSTTGTTLPPNNWLSVYGGSAWTFDANRKEYYYHAFSEDEPDLNLRNEAVVAELDSSLRLWLSRGIDGFRMYGAQYLFESSQTLENEPAVPGATQSSNEYGSLIHDHTTFQPESYNLMEHWRQLIDDFSSNDGKARSRYYPRLLIAEVDGHTRETVPFMSEVVNGTLHKRAHIATNKQLVKIDANCKTECIYKLITAWQLQSGTDVWPNWQLGNADSSRVATRIKDRLYTNAFNMLLLTLPGTPIVYYGEEIGMQDIALNTSLCAEESVVENTCRLVNRAPMQWSDSKFAGFNSGNVTWIPVNADYHSVNVKAQLAHGAGASALGVFRELTVLRQKPSFQWGKLYVATQSNVLFYVRKAEGFDGYLVAINFGPDPSTVDLTAGYQEDVSSLPTVGNLVATTGHFEGPGRSIAFQVGTVVKLSSVYMKPGEGIIVQLPVD